MASSAALSKLADNTALSKLADNTALSKLADNNIDMMFGFLEYIGLNKKIQASICSKIKRTISLPDAERECANNTPVDAMNLLLRDILNLYYINFSNMPFEFTETLPTEIRASICSISRVSVRKQVQLLRECLINITTHLLEIIGKKRLYAKLLEVYKEVVYKEAAAKPLEDIVEESPAAGVGRINGGADGFFVRMTKRIKDTLVGFTLKHRIFGDKIADVVATKITKNLTKQGIDHADTHAYVKGMIHDIMPQLGKVLDHVAKCSRISPANNSLVECVNALELSDLSRGIVSGIIKPATLKTVTNVITCMVYIIINKADALNVLCAKPEWTAVWRSAASSAAQAPMSMKQAALLAMRVVINGECEVDAVKKTC